MHVKVTACVQLVGESNEVTLRTVIKCGLYRNFITNGDLMLHKAVCLTSHDC